MKIIFVIIFSLASYLIVDAQQQFVIQSEFLVKPDTVWVFTPAENTSNDTLPVIYLLHGWSGNYHQWDNIIDCQQYANKYNMIIVCPDGLYDSWYINSPMEYENKFESFFVLELAPIVSENFNINKDNIFITGFSMGGHGALYLLEKLPKYFKSAGSLSGLLDLRNWHTYYGINRVVGINESNTPNNLLLEYSVIGNIQNIKDKKIIVSCGTEDPFYGLNLQFVDSCRANNIDVNLVESEGAHNSKYWSSSIVDHFEFFSEQINDHKIK